MRMRNVLSVVLVSIVLTVAAGCSRVNQDWRSAQAADTIEGYDDFVGKHAQSEFSEQAKARVKQLTEERDWERATVADSAEAYQQFLAQHPDGKWAQEARIRIENFNVLDGTGGKKLDAAAGLPPAAAPGTAVAPTSLPKAAPATATPKAAASAAAKAPTIAEPAPKAAAKPAPKVIVPSKVAAPVLKAAQPAASGAHRIQLGAFSSEAKAEQEWQRVSKAYGELKGLSYQVASVQKASGKLYRLQVTVASAERGRAICSALTARKQACVAVHP